MGVYVTLIDELRNRIESAQASGKKLDSSTAMGLKKFYIGNRSLVEGLNEMPSIVLSDTDLMITESKFSLNGNKTPAGRVVGEVGISLFLKFPITDDHAQNRLYKTSDSTGVLYFIEKLLDVLNETTGQTVDPRMGANSLTSADWEVSVAAVADTFVVYEIKSKIYTGMISINGRA